MKENSRSSLQAKDTKSKIIELKPEMELPPESSNIIDLTDFMDDPGHVDPIDQPEPELNTHPEGDARELPAEKGPESDIEAEVDAAFDAFQELEPLEDSYVDDLPEPEIEKIEEIKTNAAEEASAPADQAALDLTDLENEPADDDIIELADIVDPDELRFDAVDTAVDNDLQEDDTVIELTDIIDSAELKTGTLDAEAADDDIIELTDKVDPDEIARELEAAKRAALQGVADSQIIQLTDVLKAVRHQTGPDEVDTAQTSGGEKLAADLGMEIQEELAESFGTVPTQQIEATIEKIIRTRYADKIERLIARAVEKAVSNEIQFIKRTFMEDNDPSE